MSGTITAARTIRSTRGAWCAKSAVTCASRSNSLCTTGCSQGGNGSDNSAAERLRRDALIDAPPALVRRVANSHGSHMALHQQQQQQQASAAATSQQLHHQQAQHPAALQTAPSTASSGQLPAPGAIGHSPQLAHAESGGVRPFLDQ